MSLCRGARFSDAWLNGRLTFLHRWLDAWRSRSSLRRGRRRSCRGWGGRRGGWRALHGSGGPNVSPLQRHIDDGTALRTAGLLSGSSGAHPERGGASGTAALKFHVAIRSFKENRCRHYQAAGGAPQGMGKAGNGHKIASRNTKKRGFSNRLWDRNACFHLRALLCLFVAIPLLAPLRFVSRARKACQLCQVPHYAQHAAFAG